MRFILLKTFLGLCCLWLTNCGVGSSRNIGSSATPESGLSTSQIKAVTPFTPVPENILAEFMADAIAQGFKIEDERLNNLYIEFVDEELISKTGTKPLGVCKWEIDSVRVALPELWPYEYPTELRFKRVVYHELGHCLLHLLHNDDKVSGITADYRVMGTKETLLNKDLTDQSWPEILNLFFSYAGEVQTNETDGIKDEVGIELTGKKADHSGLSCALYHQ